jgi:hypothetical protein
MIFHYKPSNYWGTPIYGKPQVMIARLKKRNHAFKTTEIRILGSQEVGLTALVAERKWND